MDLTPHFSSKKHHSVGQQPKPESQPVENKQLSAICQVSKIDYTKPDLGLSKDLVAALAKDKAILYKAQTSAQDIAGILLKWMDSFYREGVTLDKDLSLYALEMQSMFHYLAVPRESIPDIQKQEWFYTNAQFIRNCIRNCVVDDACRDRFGEYRVCMSKAVSIIDAIFKHAAATHIQEGLKPHLGVLLGFILNTSEYTFNQQDILKLLTDLAQLSETVYKDKNCLFKTFHPLFKKWYLPLIRGLKNYLCDKDKYADCPLEALLFLLQTIDHPKESELSKLLPTVLDAMESQQDHFQDGPLALAYAQVYAKFLGLYFRNDEHCVALDRPFKQKRLLRCMFLSSSASGAGPGLTLGAIAKILDFEAVKSLPTAQGQGEACARFVNQCYAFSRSISRDNRNLREYKMDTLFKGYFKKLSSFCCNDFSYIFSELWQQLDVYIKELAKDKEPNELFQNVLSFIKSFAAILQKEIWEQRFCGPNPASCSALIENILKNQIRPFAEDSIGEAHTKTKLLADLVTFLSSAKEKLKLSQPSDWLMQKPLEWLIDNMKVQTLWTLVSPYLQEPQKYKPHEHAICLDLLKRIQGQLAREASISLVKSLENQKDFFEKGLYSQDYHALYQDALISYFFHKMADSEVYFTEYEKDKLRLHRVAGPLYTAFVKRVLSQEKLIYVDNPLNGEDLEVATVPLLKDLKCKVILNNKGYFDVDKDFIDKLSLSPTEGNPLQLSVEDKTPIGYTVYIPEDPRAVLVEVYGGHNKEDKKNDRMALVGRLERGLLEQKVAVIKLSLPDLLELEDHQSEMPTKLYEKIQACIHRFHTVLSNEPERLHEGLCVLKGLPIGLYGASFGGALTFNQSLRYPKTFTRYISHSGVLDPDSSDVDRGTISKRFPVAKKAKDLQDTYLELHTANDPRVNVQCSLGFYEKADAEGKRVKLSVLPKGGRFIHSTGSSAFTYTGHAYPSFKKGFEFYIQEIVDFLTKDQAITPLTRTISQWRAHTYKNYMGKYMYTSDDPTRDPSRSLEARVLSELYLLYKNACVFRSKASGKIRGQGDALAEPSKILDAAHTDAIWDQYYFPQYKAYKAAEFLLDQQGQLHAFLKRKDLDMLFLKTAEGFLQKHWIHFEESLNMKVDSKTVDFSAIAQELADMFKQSFGIKGAQIRVTSYRDIDDLNLSLKHLDFLATLFSVHPQLIEENISKDALANITKESQHLKEAFLRTLGKTRQLGSKVLTQGIGSWHRKEKLKTLVERCRKELEKDGLEGR